jgi:hypothetical protein
MPPDPVRPVDSSSRRIAVLGIARKAGPVDCDRVLDRNLDLDRIGFLDQGGYLDYVGFLDQDEQWAAADRVDSARQSDGPTRSTLRQQAVEPIEMVSGQRPGRGPDGALVPDPTRPKAQHPSADRGRMGRHGRNVERPITPDCVIEGHVGQLVEGLEVIGQQVGRACQRRDDSTAQDVIQQRDRLVTQADPGEGWVRVVRVLPRS